MQKMENFEHVMSGDPKKRVGEQIGHYRLMSWLGRGAFADVYLGEHIYLKKHSAIKMLHVHLPEKAQKAFLSEACTIAQLNHPNIVQVLDYGLENGIPFLVMAYAPNGSLRLRFPEGTCVPLEQVIPLVQQLAAALDYAHQHKVIHRDVKPENMLIGAENQILLSDFGLALSARNAHSQTVNVMAGTALYMAPELWGRGKAHFASDQYALGVITYEWLCGHCPFTGSSFIQIGTQHVSAQPPSLCQSVPNLPAAVEQVVFKALVKDRAQRYDSVTAFADALQDALVHQRDTTVGISHSQVQHDLDQTPSQEEDADNEWLAHLLGEQESNDLLTIGSASLGYEQHKSSRDTRDEIIVSLHRDMPLRRRILPNWSKVLGLVLLCFVTIASGTYAAFSLVRTRKPDSPVHSAQAVEQVPIVPAQEGISPTPLATSPVSVRPTPQPTPQPTPIVSGASSGLIGYWPLNEGSGTLAQDASGDGHPAQINGATWTTGPLGNALSFDGSDDTVDTHQPIVNTSASYTVAAWVLLSRLNNFSTAVSQDGNIASGFYLQATPDNQFAFSLLSSDSNTPATRATSNFTLTANVWYHLVGIYNATTTQSSLYVNGVLRSTQTVPPAWNARGETVIGRAVNGRDSWLGKIEDVRLYNRVLSATDVTNLYASFGKQG